MIQQFHLADAGDGTVAVFADISPADADLIRSHKPQILAYFRDQVRASEELQALLHRNLAQIPGVEQIRKAKKDGPHSPALHQLLAQYPDAAFALQVADGQKDPCFDYACICHDACRMICSGVPIPEVRAAFQKASDLLLAKYIWA